MRSYDDMRSEMEELLKRSEQLRAESASAMDESDSLRKRSVDIRQLDPEQAEALWIESEELRTKARELMRESVELRIKAADIKHRLDIREQIESLPENADKLWRKAVRG